MKNLMMIPAGLIGLMSFGSSSGPINPSAKPTMTIIADTTVPGQHSAHMKGNSSDSSSTNSQGDWKGKSKHKGTTTPGSTGTGTGTSSGSGSGTGTSSGTGSGTNQ
ncbi:MAG: hypothetical protein H0X41_10445 [Chitinophagaceae bacterium]|nr:hypothetical protein [Chitinophagaceae bacterium]